MISDLPAQSLIRCRTAQKPGSKPPRRGSPFWVPIPTANLASTPRTERQTAGACDHQRPAKATIERAELVKQKAIRHLLEAARSKSKFSRLDCCVWASSSQIPCLPMLSPLLCQLRSHLSWPIARQVHAQTQDRVSASPADQAFFLLASIRRWGSSSGNHAD